jgi:hypothetical protein
VHEIEALGFRAASEQGAAVLGAHGVPAHVGHAQFGHVGETVGGGVHPAEAGAAALLAAARHHLHAEADAEHGLAPLDDVLGQRGHQAGAVQLAHAAVEVADAGEHQLVGGFDVGSGGADAGAGAYLAQHVCDGSDVAYAVVDNDDHQGSSADWVKKILWLCRRQRLMRVMRDGFS